MLNKQLRRISPGNSLLVICASGAATFVALLLWSSSRDSAQGSASMAAPSTQTTAPTAIAVPQAPAAAAAIKPPASDQQVARARARKAATKRSLQRAVGQMIVSGVPGTTATPALLQRIRAGHVGGVILMGENIRTVAQVREMVNRLKAAASAGARPNLMVMTDQEGGIVKRFLSAAPSVSARAMGSSGSPESQARAQGARTGADLVDRGVNVDLAPVADVTASDANFLGTRTFGGNPAIVSAGACGFAAGLRSARVGSAFKHFPGLGRALGANTDVEPVSIAAPYGALARDWAPYRRCAGRRGSMVMVSNASYPALTGNVPAVLAPVTYKTLSDLGIRGPFITDSLTAGALKPYARVARKAAAAGADLLLYTSADAAIAAYRQLVTAVESGALPKSRVRSAERAITTYKRTIHP